VRRPPRPVRMRGSSLPDKAREVDGGRTDVRTYINDHSMLSTNSMGGYVRPLKISVHT
jgi:hypothetical protein